MAKLAFGSRTATDLVKILFCLHFIHAAIAINMLHAVCKQKSTELLQCST